MILRLLAIMALAVAPALGPERHARLIDARPAPIGRIATAIAKWENCTTWRNSGCLVWAGQANAMRNSRGYATFRTKAAGDAALVALVTHRVRSGKTLHEVLSIWGSCESVLRELDLPGNLVVEKNVWWQ